MQDDDAFLRFHLIFFYLEMFLRAFFPVHGHGVGVLVFAELVVGAGGGESHAEVVQVDFFRSAGG